MTTFFSLSAVGRSIIYCGNKTVRIVKFHFCLLQNQADNTSKHYLDILMFPVFLLLLPAAKDIMSDICPQSSSVALEKKERLHFITQGAG